MSEEVNAQAAAPAMKSIEVPSATVAPQAPLAKEPEAKPVPEEDAAKLAAQGEADDPDEGAEDDGHEDDDAQEEQKRAELPRGVKRKLAKQSKKLAMQGLEIAALQAQLQAFAQQQSRPQQQDHQQQGGKPRLEDYDFDHESYERALQAHWEGERAAAARYQSYEQRVNQYATKDPDGWLAAISAPVNYTDAMLEAITESEVGPEIGVYLARNIDEANRISQMSPASAIRAIGKIEARLESKPAQVELPKKTTAAPPPPTTVTGSSGVTRDINDPSLTPAERIAMFKARRQQKR